MFQEQNPCHFQVLKLTENPLKILRKFLECHLQLSHGKSVLSLHAVNPDIHRHWLSSNSTEILTRSFCVNHYNRLEIPYKRAELQHNESVYGDKAALSRYMNRNINIVNNTNPHPNLFPLLIYRERADKAVVYPASNNIKPKTKFCVTQKQILLHNLKTVCHELQVTIHTTVILLCIIY